MQHNKEQFVRAHPQYGYGCSSIDAAAPPQLEIDRMRADEFTHMRDSVYLDHAGATMYSSVQLQCVFTELSTHMFTNPHSTTTTAAHASESTAAHVERVRRQTLQFLGATADEYELVFTSGATAALKLVGECFPWHRDGASRFAYAVDSHTSVLGIRAYAAASGASLHCVSLDDMERLAAANDALDPAALRHDNNDDDDAPPSLFAFPAECNFSGTRHPLSIVQRVRAHGLAGLDLDLDRSNTTNTTNATKRQHRWFVLLDAAKYATTHALELSTVAYAPDFVVLSFYKLCGYPTGLGALLVHRKRALPLLRKVYFGGGAVQSILATQHVVIPRGLATATDAASAAGWSDGTTPFLSILALRHGLDQLTRIGMARIAAHTAALTQLLAAELLALTHANGRNACELYGRQWTSKASQTAARGAVVTCNFRRADRTYVGYTEVETLAALHHIQVRVGCLCNPGACQTYLARSDADVLAAIDAGHVCGGAMDLFDGRPTGAVRLSLGYMSTYEDVAAFVTFARTFFVSHRNVDSENALFMKSCIAEKQLVHRMTITPTATSVHLCKIALFPIKSCRAQSERAWPVGARGLLFDREWAIVDAATHRALTLKDAPQLCFVRPRVDLAQQTLTIAFGTQCSGNNSDTFVLSLNQALDAQTKDAHSDAMRDLRVCAGACKGRDVRGDVSHWLSTRLGRACALVRVVPSHLRDAQVTPTTRTSDASSPTRLASTASKIGFANQAQFLLVSRASVAHLNAALAAADVALAVHEDAFRANLVVDGCDAFAEDTWTQLRICRNDADSDQERASESRSGVAFDVSGPCSRCSMINVDPVTSAFDRAPLQTLSRYRRERSSIFFGQFLTRRRSNGSGGHSDEVGRSCGESSTLQWLHVGDAIMLK